MNLDLRVALRELRRRPVGAIAGIVVLAVSIAVTTSMFSVVDGLLFRPLPFTEPEQLVSVGYRLAGGRPAELFLSPSMSDARGKLLAALENSPLVASSTQAGGKTFFDPGSARETGLQVTGADSRFFKLLGLAPAEGTTFSTDDERTPAALSLESDAPLPIILGHDAAARLFGSMAAAPGIHQLAGRSVLVIGVMGAGVKFPGETNVWAPVPSARNRPPAYLRLKPNATADQLAQVFPDLEFTPLREAVRSSATGGPVALFVAAALLMSITWVQVAALTVSDVVGRLKEVGIRLALGARPRHIHSQLAIRNALIGGLSFGVAWLAASPLTVSITSLLPPEVRRGQYLTVDVRAFVFSCAVSALGLVLLTILPASFVRRVASIGTLSGQWLTKPLRPERWRQAFLICQLALTALLMYVSGLALHSFVNASRFDYGFVANDILLFTPPPWARSSATAAQLTADFNLHSKRVEATIEELQSLPEVQGVAGLFSGPLGTGLSAEGTAITSFDGQARPEVRARANTVSPSFVRTFKASIIAGTDFEAAQPAIGDGLVIVNETLAKQLVPEIAPGGPALWPTVVNREMATAVGRGRVVGVVRDLVQSTLAAPSVPEFFVASHRGTGFSRIAIRVQARDEPRVRQAVQTVWGTLPAHPLAYMTDELTRSLLPYRNESLMLGLITLFSLPIAAFGLVGALTYLVRARSRETAIRIALGADNAVVGNAIVVWALMRVAVGVLAGIVLGVSVSSVLHHQLFAVKPLDAWTVAFVAAGLFLLGWAASTLPAREMARANPADLLRQV